MGNVMRQTTPQNSPKRDVNRQLQAKTPKSIHRNISGTINATNKRFEERVQTTKSTSWWSIITPKANTTWLTAAVLKSIWRHIFAEGGSIWIKLCSLVQNNMPITVILSKSKPEVEFRYSGRLFFQYRSSYSSAVNWDMSTKFGLVTDIELLMTATSTNRKPELELSSRGHHLEKSIWRLISYFRITWSDMDKVWQLYAEYHADYGDVVEIETGKRISLRTFVFPNRK